MTREEILARIIKYKMLGDNSLESGYRAMLAFHDGAIEVAGKPSEWFRKRINIIEAPRAKLYNTK